MSQSYDAAFRCTAYDPIPRRGGDDLPGREIAQDLARQLSQLGVTVQSVVPEEPWWAVRVSEKDRELDILVYILVPDEDRSKAVWQVSVPSEESSFFGFFKKDESTARIALVRAVHAALTMVPNVYDIRWFREDGGNPFSSTTYSAHPFT